jgi:DNA-binding CsgD family transcriptional regulator
VARSDPLSTTDRRLLSLLVAGVADKAIATQMGLSRRTVQRHIPHVMTLAGAATRMHLAWQAAPDGVPDTQVPSTAARLNALLRQSPDPALTPRRNRPHDQMAGAAVQRPSQPVATGPER